MSTTTALPVHRVAMTNSFKQIAKKAVLPAIHITGVCEITEEEILINRGKYSNEHLILPGLCISLSEQQHQVSFRPSHHRISAQSGSTAYSSMRSDSINVESALFVPSNHSSMVSNHSSS